MRDFGALEGDMTVNTGTGEIEVHKKGRDEWIVNLVETGLPTLTGGRIKRLKPWLGSGTFMLTWGDGVSDVDIRKLLAFHRSHGKIATLTAVRRLYGHLTNGDQLSASGEAADVAG
jgi:glucose-1-phosphate cytidylyltransferase